MIKNAKSIEFLYNYCQYYMQSYPLEQHPQHAGQFRVGVHIEVHDGLKPYKARVFHPLDLQGQPVNARKLSASDFWDGGRICIGNEMIKSFSGKLEQNKFLYMRKMRQKPLFIVKYFFSGIYPFTSTPNSDFR